MSDVKYVKTNDIETADLEAATVLTSDLSHLVHPQHYRPEIETPKVWVAGRGVEIQDALGRTYLDGLSGMWNVSLGYGRPELIEAATKQASTLAYTNSYAGSTNPVIAALAEELSELIYPGIVSFFFTSGGSEATDASIRLARYYWRAQGKFNKQKIIARELSYHGSTVAAASATGVAEFSTSFGGRLPNFHHIASPYPYRFVGPTGVSPGIAAANLLEDLILEQGPDRVAAFIAEPVQGGGGGIIVPPDDYFPRIREICDLYDVLLISDDVITGFGRTGRWFGLEHWGVSPDIVQFAKGITSGYFPFGGVGVNQKIKDVLDDADSQHRWWHGYTYSGHPIGAAVARATIRVIKDEHLVGKAQKQGERLLEQLHSALDSHPHIGDIRGLGLMAAVEPVVSRETKEPFPAAENVSSRIRDELAKHGLITRVLDNAICLAPPLVISETQIDQIVQILTKSIREVTGV